MHFKPAWDYEDIHDGNLVKGQKTRIPIYRAYKDRFQFPYGFLTYGCAKWSVQSFLICFLFLRADPGSSYHDKSFAKDKTVILYCASGGRSVLGGKVLKDMGYDRVYNLGAFKDWAESGSGSIDKPIEPGM